MSKTAIVTKKTEFHRLVNDPRFLDVHALSPTTAILTYQSMVVDYHSNIPSISSKIYQKSKFMLYRGQYTLKSFRLLRSAFTPLPNKLTHSSFPKPTIGFFFIAARLCSFAGDGGVRLAGSDTGRIKVEPMNKNNNTIILKVKPTDKENQETATYFIYPTKQIPIISLGNGIVHPLNSKKSNYFYKTTNAWSTVTPSMHNSFPNNISKALVP